MLEGKAKVVVYFDSLLILILISEYMSLITAVAQHLYSPLPRYILPHIPHIHIHPAGETIRQGHLDIPYIFTSSALS